MGTIINGCNTPLNQINGTVPDMSGALQDYFQKMVFIPVAKTLSGFQVVENASPIEFWGVIMPLTGQRLAMKDIGQRDWIWNLLYAEPGVILKPDDVMQYLGFQYRVTSKKDYSLYGYIEYELCQDYVGTP